MLIDYPLLFEVKRHPTTASPEPASHPLIQLLALIVLGGGDRGVRLLQGIRCDLCPLSQLPTSTGSLWGGWVGSILVYTAHIFLEVSSSCHGSFDVLFVKPLYTLLTALKPLLFNFENWGNGRWWQPIGWLTADLQNTQIILQTISLRSSSQQLAGAGVESQAGISTLTAWLSSIFVWHSDPIHIIMS